MPILTEDERIGTVLSGKYRVRSVLARGGMGVLFTGEHTWTGRSVAIKLLSPTQTGDTSAAARFLREGRAATTLRHPHVVEVLDMGEAEDGALFMVLELLDGTDLQAVRRATGPMDPAHAVELLTPIIDALATVHERGFVHRDLKPSNIFLARQGNGRFLPKLLDFGIAKALEGDASATSTGMIVGTPHYMAPEQATGTSVIGPRADAWALGIVLYELISGCLPYDGPSPTAVLIAVLQSKHASLADVAPSTPPALVDEIERALSRDPADRPGDLRAWAASLRAATGLPALALPLHAPIVIASDTTTRAIAAAVESHGSTDRPPPLADSAFMREEARARTVREPTPRRWIALASAAGALVVLAILIAVAVSSRPPEPIARPLGAAPVVPREVDAAPAAPPSPTVDLIDPVVPAAVAEEANDAPVRPQRPPRARPERVRPGEGQGRERRPIAEITREW